PIQRWFFAREWANPHHYNQAVLLAVREGLESRALREVVKALVDHHDGLRLRYERSGEQPEWRQRLISTAAALEQGGWFEEVELEGGDEQERAMRIEAEAERAQRSLHLSAGPLL